MWKVFERVLGLVLCLTISLGMLIQSAVLGFAEEAQNAQLVTSSVAQSSTDGTPTVEPFKILFGDVSGDGEVDTADLMYLRRFLIGRISEFPSKYGLILSDFDSNGFVDSGDYTTLRKYLLEIITAFPGDANKDGYVENSEANSTLLNLLNNPQATPTPTIIVTSTQTPTPTLDPSMVEDVVYDFSTGLMGWDKAWGDFFGSAPVEHDTTVGDGSLKVNVNFLNSGDWEDANIGVPLVSSGKFDLECYGKIEYDLYVPNPSKFKGMLKLSTAINDKWQTVKDWVIVDVSALEKVTIGGTEYGKIHRTDAIGSSIVKNDSSNLVLRINITGAAYEGPVYFDNIKIAKASTEAPTPTVPAVSIVAPKVLPLISLDVPAYASSGKASSANDADYKTTWQGAVPGWIAYDLSKVAEANRGQINLVWYNNDTNDYNYKLGYNYTHGVNETINSLKAYTVEVNAAAGGTEAPTAGWEVKETVTDNIFHSRQHVLDLTGYNWIRLNITEVNATNAKINMDIHDASQGVEDDWIFYGDSITAGGMTLTGDKSFAQMVNSALPSYYPVAENGGIGGTFSSTCADNIDQWLSVFPGKFVCIAYGTNDAWGNSSGAGAYYENMEKIVRAVLLAGKIPVVSKIPYSTLSDVADNVPLYNAKIDALYTAYPQIVKGPDLWTFFKTTPSYLGTDGVHPTQDGYNAMRQEWANTMIAKIYRAVSVTSTPRPIPTTRIDKVAVSTEDFDLSSVKLTDIEASNGTTSLYAYLRGIAGKKLLFGHQHDTTWGNTVSNYKDGTESDIKNAVGQYPAVYGWDTLSIEGKEHPGNLSSTPEQNADVLIVVAKKAYQRGGIITLSSHMPNFVTGGSFNDTSGRVVSQILPGGEKHAEYNEFLDNVAYFAYNLKGDDGNLIPVIFRPFHENTGSWFWWGASFCSPDQYIKLYRYTVEYLRDTKGVHNFLYAYSPSSNFSTEDDFLVCYPGDQYVDILGFDQYDDSLTVEQDPNWMKSLVTRAELMTTIADKRSKVFALTETGLSKGVLVENNINLNWFTDLLTALKESAESGKSKIAYTLVWANFDFSQFWTPYRDHSEKGNNEMLADFVSFYNDDFAAFGDSVNDAYGLTVNNTAKDPYMYVSSPYDKDIVTGATTIKARVFEGGKTVESVTYSVVGDAISYPMTKSGENEYSALWTPTFEQNGGVTDITVKVTYEDYDVQEETVSVKVFATVPMGKLTFDEDVSGAAY